MDIILKGDHPLCVAEDLGDVFDGTRALDKLEGCVRIIRSIHMGDATVIAPSQALTKEDFGKDPDLGFRDRWQPERRYFVEDASEIDDPSEGRPRLRKSWPPSAALGPR